MMIAPPSGISGSAFCTVNSVPLTLTLMTLSKPASVTASNGNAEFADAGAGENNINPAFLGFHFGVQTVEIREASRVSLHPGDVPADFLDRLVELFLTPAGDEDVCAFCDEELRRCQGHAGCRSGDDRNLAFELSHDLSPRFNPAELHQLRCS